MKFVCDRCGKRYASTDEPVPGRLYRIPCKCGHVILVRGDATGGVTPAGPVGAPAGGRPSPSAVAPRPAPTGRPQPPAGGEVPQFDGDPFAATVAPPVHPAATSASDLGAPGASGDVPSPGPLQREPAIRLEEPTPPSLRQPYPEPRSFDGPAGGLEIEPLAGGSGPAPRVPAPDDPFAGVAASLAGAPPATSQDGARPSFARPVPAPPPFARLERGGTVREPSLDLGASASIMARARRKRSRRGLLIALVVGLAAAGAVGAWYFVISKGATSTTTATVDIDAERPRRAAPAPQRPEPNPPREPPPTPPEAAPAPEPAPAAAVTAVAPTAPKAPAERTVRETAPRPKAPRQPAAAPAPAPPPPAEPAPAPAPPIQETAPAAATAAPTPQPPAAGAASKTLQPEDVIAVVRARREEFDACIAQAVETGTPGKWLGRRVDLLVFVSPTGRVSSAAVDDPEVEPTELGACLRVVARKMVFPAFEGEAVPLALPLRLGKSE